MCNTNTQLVNSWSLVNLQPFLLGQRADHTQLFSCFPFRFCVCPAFIGVCSSHFHNSGTIFIDYGGKSRYSQVLFLGRAQTAQRSYGVRNSANCSFAVVSTLHWAMVGVSLPVHNLNTDTCWGKPCRSWTVEKVKVCYSHGALQAVFPLSSLIFVNLLS